MSALLQLAVDEGLVVTAHGFERLSAELEALKSVQRAALSEELRDARADGDADNPAVFELLEEQAQLEQRISVLEGQVAAARVAAPGDDGIASIGSSVRVRHCHSGDITEYHLVGSVEADADKGRVSVEAPVGRALVGRRSGERLVAETPRGPLELEILAVATAT